METTPKCPECNTRHAAQRGNCDPIEKRRGPPVTSPDHPSNDGRWAKTLAVLK